MTADPRIVVGIDPDKTRTAIAWAVLVDPVARVYEMRGLIGGGASRARVPWTSITDALEWLPAMAQIETVAVTQIRVSVETQAASSPRSTDVEALRRVRYHWDAACELLGCECEHVDKAAWQSLVLRKLQPPRGARGEGAIKRVYQDHARASLGSVVANEDQAAAFGILQWSVEVRLGATIDLRKMQVGP